MTTKRCITCGCEKSVTADFYKHPEMADGHLNKCIECTLAYRRERQRQGRTREHDRARANQPHRVAARKEYAKSEAGKKAKLRNQKTQRSRYPEKSYARGVVAYALLKGRLQRQPCEVCGEAKSHAHHDDYSKPLDVRWLCRFHHMEHHRNAQRLAEREAA